MKITTLSALNFMSFKKLDFVFPDTGLHFVGGEVHGKAMSNSNGAGKSALFESLCFGLYGKTIRNAGKDDIINRSVGKNCMVGIELESDGHEYTIFRFRGDSENGNELRLIKGEQDITTGTVITTQEMIDQIIGLNWLVFSNAVIFGEKARRFTQAKDSEKKEIFDEILMLQQYQEAQLNVKNDTKSLKEDLVAHNQDIDMIVLSLDQYKTSYAEEEKRLEEAKEEGKGVEQQIVGLKAEVKEAEEKIKKIEVEFSTLEQNKQTVLDANTELYKTVTDLTEKKGVIVSEVRGTEDQARVEYRKLADRHSEITTILSSNSLPVNERCPKCRQPVTEESIVEVKKHYTEEKTVLDGRLMEAEKVLKDAEGVRFKVEKEQDDKIQEVVDLRHEYDVQLVKIDNDIDGVASQVLQAKAIIESKGREIGLMESAIEVNLQQIEKRMEVVLEKMDPLQKKLLELKNLATEIAGELEYYEFWIEGFGNRGIKSFLLDEVVPELNKKANYYASMLMDDEVQIEFKTESTLKSGESRDKFNVSIVYGGGEVAYDNCSSGEKGRIDVSILLALQNLIFSRNANNSNLVIFDEVFESLDITGIERLVNLLKEEAKDKALLVISHQNELRDYFDNQILVVKDNAGFSRIE